jgi:hypothetical protein
VDEDRIVRFVIKDKPELYLELDNMPIRDAVVAGLMGLMMKRRSPARS